MFSHPLLEDLLKFDPDSLFAKDIEYYGIPLVYNPATIIDINDWLINHGDNIIYLYGSIDPWSGGEIALEGGTNALKIMQDGGDHRIKIADLDEKNLVLSTLESWLGIDINYAATKGKKIIYIDRDKSFETDLIIKD